MRISIPEGEIQGRRTLGQRLPAGDVDKRELVHLSAASGPLLAPAPDGSTAVALVRQPAPRRDRVTVFDVASLRIRCSHPLEAGVSYSGLLLGRSGRLYAYGTRPAGSARRRDAVLSIIETETGALAGSRILREAAEPGERASSGKDWFPYGVR